MNDAPAIALIMPARDEALSLPRVLQRVPEIVQRVVVVDNGSEDATGEVARLYGAEVISEPVAGYGRACLAGIDALADDPPEIVCFADADGSDDVFVLPQLLAPITDGIADFTLERRMPEAGFAFTVPQRFGNLLSTRLIRLFWNYRFGDLGPMRALRWEALQALRMDDLDYGWTVQMQVRAARLGMHIQEIPLPCRPRLAGRSKVSGTIRGTIGAGVKILSVIARERLSPPPLAALPPSTAPK